MPCDRPESGGGAASPAIETGAGERAKAEELHAQETTLDNGDTLPALDEFLSELDALELSEDLLDGKPAKLGKTAKAAKEARPEEETAEAFRKDVPTSVAIWTKPRWWKRDRPCAPRPCG